MSPEWRCPLNSCVPKGEVPLYFLQDCAQLLRSYFDLLQTWCTKPLAVGCLRFETLCTVNLSSALICSTNLILSPVSATLCATNFIKFLPFATLCAANYINCLTSATFSGASFIQCLSSAALCATNFFCSILSSKFR